MAYAVGLSKRNYEELNKYAEVYKTSKANMVEIILAYFFSLCGDEQQEILKEIEKIRYKGQLVAEKQRLLNRIKEIEKELN